MRYLLLTIAVSIFAIVLLLTSCESDKDVESKDKLNGSVVTILRFKGCEYVFVGRGYSSWGSHLGTCDNPIHHPAMIEPYEYRITLNDNDWITVRHADGSIVGEVRVDSSSQLGKLFYHDNE